MYCSRLFALVAVLVLSACTSVPDGIQAVTGFEQTRYLGKWYEIARLDHSFERGLDQVTATYSLRDDGGIQVINKGFNRETGEWREAHGKAFFVGADDIGHLKVSFFGPFYASYVIAALDKQTYSHALVTGPNRDYLWILARQPELDSKVQEQLIAQAKAWGFATEQLIFVKH